MGKRRTHRVGLSQNSFLHWTQPAGGFSVCVLEGGLQHCVHGDDPNYNLHTQSDRGREGGRERKREDTLREEGERERERGGECEFVS